MSTRRSGDAKIIELTLLLLVASYQEDTHAVAAIHLPWSSLQNGLNRNFGISWNPGLRDLDLSGQLLFVGLYDGFVMILGYSRMRCYVLICATLIPLRHGGKTVSHYLRDHLHSLFETVDPSEAPKMVNWLKSFGIPESIKL